MKLGLSDGYKMINKLDERRVSPILDRREIDAKIVAADDEMSQTLGRFQKFVAEALSSAEGGLENDVFVEKIMYLRIEAMRISERFEDFVDTLDKVLQDSDANVN